MDCRAKYGSMVCATQSVDCANPYFAPDICISGMLTKIHPIMSCTCVHSTDLIDRVCKHATIMIFARKISNKTAYQSREFAYKSGVDPGGKA